jgi:hypothetical protein
VRYVLIVIAATACANCGGNNHDIDAAVTGDGPCGADLFFTGELVDWDETTTNFCGVFNAKMQVDGDASRTDMTNPNGRFQLCIAHAATTLIDITPPTGPSQCVTTGLYQIPGIAIANQQVIATGKTFSARMITMGRLMQFFTGYDPAKATVFVHVEGTQHPVTSSATHDTPLVFDGATWGPGNSGANIVFPGTDVAGGTTTIGVTGGSAIGTGAVPVAANTFTYVTIVGN